MIAHNALFRRRRFLNWFPLGLTYAFLYMGRYNLTVAKTALGDLLTKEDFGLVFGAGAVVYGFAFLLNGPLTDRMGGKRAILAAAGGSALANIAMGLFVGAHAGGGGASLAGPMALLYAVNMYFQSFGAVAIVKVNAAWFHVRERGGFSGVFGTMIASGVFLAFTVNGRIVEALKAAGAGVEGTVWVFYLPAAILLVMFAVEWALLADTPAEAGLSNFDTGDAKLGDDGAPVPLRTILHHVFTNPVILTVALVEFCTGVLRNGIMHWFPIYTAEVWALPADHALRDGSWRDPLLVIVPFAVAAVAFVLSARVAGRNRAALIVTGAAAGLAPFLQGGWGGLQFVAGVVGGNVAGWVSDLVFSSRRAPAAAGLYALLAVCTVGLSFGLGGTNTTVAWSDGKKVPLAPGDTITAVQGVPVTGDWRAVARAVACVPSVCVTPGAAWNAAACRCSAKATGAAAGVTPPADGVIRLTVRRGGATVEVPWNDPLARARAGDVRRLAAGPLIDVSPWLLGVLVFLLSVGVIGTHGLLSGTATMDFGGRRAAATAVGVIDGFVYLGTAVQSVALGYLTTRDWAFWPLFLLPFALVGFVLLTRIWNAAPRGAGGH